MGKFLQRLRTAAFIIILIELLLIILFCIFYFFDFFEFKTIVDPIYVLFGSLILIFLDCLFIWIAIIKVSSLRRKTDLKASEVLGSDIQAAYNFAMLGLAVVDDDGIVIWTNDLFKERNISIIDMHIYDWKSELRNLMDSPDEKMTVKINDANRQYEVKYLSEAGLFIFKDVTDFENILQYSKEQAPVVGLLAIDNYSDVVGTEEDFNDSISKVKNVIFQYARDMGILLRRYRNDTYFILTNYQTLENMKNNNFSLVNKVRELGKGEDVPLTLSIGIAHDFPDVVKLADLAEEALSIAMSRGGDQVVISKYGSDMEFIGGKTEAQEKRNRVKVRVLADSLISLIKASSNVLIMGHTKADMDALGACLGIKAICDRIDKQSKIVFDLKETEYKTRAAITSSFSRDELDKIMTTPKDAESKMTHNTLLVVVDVHIPKMVMAPNLLDKATKIVVIDHHRRAEDYIESPVFNHIDPSASSASELITEFIHFASINPRIEVPPIYATIMLSGIFLDSSYFKSKNVGIRTFEACTFLKEFGADNAMADELLKDDYEEHMIVNKIISNVSTPSPGVVYAIAPTEQMFDDATLAKAANALLGVKAINASFVIGKTSNKTIKMSCRSDGTINVQILAEKMGGGGHFSAAAVVFNSQDFISVEETLKNVLANYLTSARNDKPQDIDKEE